MPGGEAMTQQDQSEQQKESEAQAQFTAPVVERFDLKAEFAQPNLRGCGCGCGCQGGGGGGGGGGTGLAVTQEPAITR